MHAKVVIIGSGPAGYTAAIYAARAMLEPVMIQGLQPGGQLTITTDVENYPGFADVIQGPWLMDQMKAQAEHVGTRIVNDLIVNVDFDRRPFVLTGDSGDVYTADSVIIATGAQAKWLGLPSEQKFQGFGVSASWEHRNFLHRGVRFYLEGRAAEIEPPLEPGVCQVDEVVVGRGRRESLAGDREVNRRGEEEDGERNGRAAESRAQSRARIAKPGVPP